MGGRYTRNSSERRLGHLQHWLLSRVLPEAVLDRCRHPESATASRAPVNPPCTLLLLLYKQPQATNKSLQTTGQGFQGDTPRAYRLHSLMFWTSARKAQMTGIWNLLEASSLPGGRGLGNDLKAGSAGIIAQTLHSGTPSQPGGEHPSEQRASHVVSLSLTISWSM